MNKESKGNQGQATPRDLKDLKIAHDDFVLVKDREGFLRKQKSLEQLMEHYASKADQDSLDSDDKDKKSEGESKISLSTMNAMGIRGSRSQKGVPQKPPSFCANTKYAHKFYFRTTSAITSYNIKVQELLAIAGMVGTVSNSTCTTIASSMKLNSITVWPAAGAVTANPEVAFTPSGYGTVPDFSYERAIPSGVTTGGGIKFSVPEGSLASFWQNGTAYAIELVTLYDIPSGSVICVSGCWSLRDSLPGVNLVGFTTVSLNAFYYSYLDGVSAHKCLPVGLPNTF